MKRLKFLPFLIALICLGSCKRFDRLTQFNLTYDTKTRISNGTSINIPFSVLTPDVETNSETEFEVHDTRKDKIQRITLNALKINIEAPSGQEFDFLKEVEIFISADGLNEVLLASKYNIDDSHTYELILDVSGTDFQEYIKKDKFVLRVRTVTDQTLFQDVDINIRSEFFVDAKALGKA